MWLIFDLNIYGRVADCNGKIVSNSYNFEVNIEERAIYDKVEIFFDGLATVLNMD